MWIVGLISDTHGTLPRGAVRALRDADEILHAGDVGGTTITQRLEQIAPIEVVAGNMDPPGSWPLEKLLQICGRRVVLVHDIGRIGAPSRDFMLRAREWEADVVVFGHSHRPAHFEQGGVRFVNPGSAGPSRGGPPTVARMTITDDAIEVQHLQVGY